MSANQAYADVQVSRARVASVSRIRWVTLILGVVCAACLPTGIGLAIWSTMNHVRLGPACAALIVTGVVLGSLLLIAAAALSGRAVDLQGLVWEQEAKYQDALERELGLRGGE